MQYKVKVKYKAEKTHIIVGLLKKGIKPHNLFKKGYPKSTVFYHYNKLFFPLQHAKLMEQIKKNNQKLRENRRSKAIHM